MRQADAVTATEIARATGSSVRWVNTVAKREQWPTAALRCRGGRKQAFPVDCLPPEIRAQVQASRKKAAAGRAGEAAGRRLAEQQVARERAKLLAAEREMAAFTRLPKERQLQARARFEILTARDMFLAAGGFAKKRGTEVFCRELAAGRVDLPGWVLESASRKAPSRATISRWESAYKAGGLPGLAPKYVSRAGETSVPEHVQEHIQGLLAAMPHMRVPAIWATLKARIGEENLPSQSSIRRYVERFRAEAEAVLEAVRNPDQFRSSFQAAFGDAAEDVTRLNQLWEFDSTPGDLMLEDGRHTVIGCIDVYSRRAKLLVRKTSNSEGIAALIRRAILDWGVPEVARTDEGADYTSYYISAVLHELGVDQEVCEPFHPEQKPHIERFFRTFSHSIVELLPGYVGHSVADRKAIEARKSFADRIMGKGKVTEEIPLTSEEFQALCDRWLEAVYHHDKHSSLGMTPFEKAASWRGEVKKIHDPRALDMLLCPPADDKYRTVGKKGIQVDNTHYIGTDLIGHEGKRLLVLLDPTDAGTIYLYKELPDRSREFVGCAYDPERAGLDRQEIAAAARKIQDEIYKKGAAELRKIAKKTSAHLAYRDILEARERETANLAPLPHHEVPWTSTGLETAAEAVRASVRGPQAPQEITPEQERAAAEVIEMARPRRPLPATEWERYEQICEDLAAGEPVSPGDRKWKEDYERWLETGKKQAL